MCFRANKFGKTERLLRPKKKNYITMNHKYTMPFSQKKKKNTHTHTHTGTRLLNWCKAKQ